MNDSSTNPGHRPQPQLDITGPSNTNIYKNWAAPSAEVTLNMSGSSLNRGESPDLSLMTRCLKIRIFGKLGGDIG